MRFKEKSGVSTTKLQGEATRADVGAAASYPKDLAQITSELGYTKPVLLNAEKQPHAGESHS